MMRVVPDAGWVIAGASGSPGSLAASKYARDVPRRNGIPLVAVLASTPPEGDLAERWRPSPYFRGLWADAARRRLSDALAAACGVVPRDLDLQPVVIRGEPGPAVVEVAGSADDLLVIGARRGGKLTRTWRGKVTRCCAAHAQCPVLAVPQPATARQMGLGPAAWALRHRELTLDRALRDWDAAA
jgi:nucleotide-binding universal stress UspA family protein